MLLCIMLTQVRATSHKPDEIYGIIERLSPGTRKIELFGRPHNVQPNWLVNVWRLMLIFTRFKTEIAQTISSGINFIEQMNGFMCILPMLRVLRLWRTFVS